MLIDWSPNNCPHLWEEVATLQGKKHTICVLCGVNKFLLEYVGPRRKRVRVSRPTQGKVTLKLSDRSRENLRQLAQQRGVSRSDIVEKLLFSLTAKVAQPKEGGIDRQVYVVEKLIFEQWEPLECALDAETAQTIVETCGSEGRLKVSEYVPKKLLARLVTALKAALDDGGSAKNMSALRGAYGQAKGVMNGGKRK